MRYSLIKPLTSCTVDSQKYKCVMEVVPDKCFVENLTSKYLFPIYCIFYPDIVNVWCVYSTWKQHLHLPVANRSYLHWFNIARSVDQSVYSYEVRIFEVLLYKHVFAVASFNKTKCMDCSHSLSIDCVQGKEINILICKIAELSL